MEENLPLNETEYETDLTLDEIREFISKCEWSWARTMVTIPHEYIYNGRCPIPFKKFIDFIKYQWIYGKMESWGGQSRPYLYVDGYKYWTMGVPEPKNRTINRQKVFNEFDALEDPFIGYYSDSDLELCALAVKLTFPLPLFDAGCGDGRFARKVGVNNKSYKAVDPSKKAVQKFRSLMSGFYKNIACSSFEESVEKWRNKDVTVIATFGSASYLMGQYLNLLNEGGVNYFLMFYKEDYCPKPFLDMHHFVRTKENLKKMFPKANIYTSNDYYIVSSKVIEWDKIKQMLIKEDELFSV